MDIFDIHNIKMEKANAMLQDRHFRKLASLFRLVELFSAVAFIAWISARLPFVIKTFNDYFQQLLSIIVSPLFIFLIGNVIILTLVLKSRQINDVDNAGTDLYEAIENNLRDAVATPETEEIVYEDKRIVSESQQNTNKISQSTNKRSPNSVSDLDLKIYRRSQSDTEKSCFLESDRFQAKLRRSETEIRRRREVKSPAVDELSNEEFQKRIEGFIARQIRFHHEEKLAIVAHN